MFEELSVMGTPMRLTKAYLPVNESFGKSLTLSLSLTQCNEGFETNFTLFHLQVSLQTFVPTPVARPSHSVCLTTGRSSQETP